MNNCAEKVVLSTLHRWNSWLHTSKYRKVSLSTFWHRILAARTKGCWDIKRESEKTISVCANNKHIVRHGGCEVNFVICIMPCYMQPHNFHNNIHTIVLLIYTCYHPYFGIRCTLWQHLFSIYGDAFPTCHPTIDPEHIRKLYHNMFECLDEHFFCARMIGDIGFIITNVSRSMFRKFSSCTALLSSPSCHRLIPIIRVVSLQYSVAQCSTSHSVSNAYNAHAHEKGHSLQLFHAVDARL